MRLAILGSGYGSKVLAPAAKNSFETVSIPFENWQSLLKDNVLFSSIDAVAIALPPSIQGEIAPLLAPHFHLFLEKPLAGTLQQAQNIQQACKKSGKIAFLDFSFRFVKPFQNAHQLIKEGKLGDVQFVSVTWLTNTRGAQLGYNWKSDIQLGGGVVNLFGSHVFDYLSWFLGILPSWFCSKTSLIPSRMAGGKLKEVTAPDTCSLVSMNGEGIPISIKLSSSLSINAGHLIKIWGSRGLLEVRNETTEFLSGFCAQFTELDSQVKILSECNDSRIDVATRAFSLFQRIIHGEKVEYPSLEEGMKVQKILDEIHGHLKENR